jgi:hypothetical protein
MHSRPCLGPLDPWFRVRARFRRSRPDKVYYWEGALKFWFNKLCQKMIDHDSRSTWGPGPSRSGLASQKYAPPPKTVLPYNFCLIKFSHSSTVEAADVPQTLFRAPLTRGSGYRVETQLRTFLKSYILLCQISPRSIQQFGFLSGANIYILHFIYYIW